MTSIGRPVSRFLPNGTLPALNLVGLVAAVAVLWWRAQRVEDQVDGLRAVVSALQVEVAAFHQFVADKP